MRLASILFFALTVHVVSAQQEIQSTHFMVNPFLLNPAYSSVDDNTDLRFGYRYQWAGIEGAPETSYLTLHAPFGKPRFARTHPGDFHNWHGAGLALVQDNIGAYQQTRFNINYSYNIGLSQGTSYGYEHKDGLRIALGAFLGWNSFRVDKGILGQSKTSSGPNISNPSTLNDPTYRRLAERSFKPSIDLSFGGMIYYAETYFLGISATQILESDMNITEEAVLARHYFISGKIKWQLNEEFFLIPAVITKVVNGAPVSYNANISADWQDKLYLGVGYRSEDALTFMVGGRIRWGEKVKKFKVSKHRYIMSFYYSFDYTLSDLGDNDLREHSKGSHEITLSFLLPPFYHERNAEDTWKWWKGGAGRKKTHR